MNRRERILGLADIVYAMAVDASSHGRVTCRQALAMHAGPVLRELVYSLPGLVFLHEGRVAVAIAAPLGYSRARDPAHEAVRPAHGLFRIRCRPVSSVAIRATESKARVDVVRERFGGRLQIAIEHGMTFHARVGGGEGNGKAQHHQSALHLQYPKAEKVVKYASSSTPAPVTHRVRSSPF